MNIVRSAAAIRQVWRDDKIFQSLGLPAGWYVCAHYAARARDRLRKSHPWMSASFRVGDRFQTYSLTSEHLGAALGVFGEGEYQAVSTLGQCVHRVLDLGGNIGMGSGYLASKFPEASYAVVEPDPRNLVVLADNLTRNGISARIFAGAIGARSGRLRLRMGSNPACSSLETLALHDLSEGVEVAVMTVDEIIRKMNWDYIDLVKMDIEGAEAEVLSQNNDWLARVGTLVLEIHPNTTPEFIGSQLEAYGFRLRRVGAGREPVFLATRRDA